MCCPLLVEVFRDHPGAGDDVVSVDQNRGRPSRIEFQEALPALPGPLLAQLGLEPHLAQRETHETRVRAERRVVQEHGTSIAGSGGENKAGIG